MRDEKDRHCEGWRKRERARKRDIENERVTDRREEKRNRDIEK